MRGEADPEDPWPPQASSRLPTFLRPWMEAAAGSQDDFTLISLFHRHGPRGERHYLASPLLLTIADAHRRLGFISEAGRLYQALVKANKLPALTEEALVSLGKIYRDQQDPAAARGVLEGARLQFPDGRFQSEGLHLLVKAMIEDQDTAGLLHFCRQWILRHPHHPERPWMYQGDRWIPMGSFVRKQDTASSDHDSWSTTGHAMLRVCAIGLLPA